MVSLDTRVPRGLRSNIIRTAKDKPCADCNIAFPYFVMDFDHVRDEKRFDISAAHKLGVTFADLLDEIEKCDVVCANCHRVRTQRKLKGDA